MNLNKVFIGGNTTRDVELKYTPSGTAIADFSIAVNHRWKDKKGEARDEVVFINVVAYGGTAENIAKFFPKGSPIFVEGRLKVEQWEKDGKKQSKTKVLVEHFHFCGGKKQSAETQEKQETWDDAVENES